MDYSETAKIKFDNLKDKQDIVVLAIESSCDETAAAVIKNGRQILSNIISSQIEIHKRFGGVVPEIASRNHTLAINSVIDEALKTANLGFNDIDAIAVTYAPGLAGALLVGVSYAKALAYALNLPLIKVNHIQGHISANYLEFSLLQPPFLAIVASGGHTSFIEVNDYNDYNIIGGTTDDAIGEAFDKTARMLGLEYPGGPNVDKLAKLGQPNIEFFKVAKATAKKDLKLSYSGLKTAVVNYLHNKKQKEEEININDVCASFSHIAVKMLVDTAMLALSRSTCDKLVLCGGVAANSYLRSQLQKQCKKEGIELFIPSLILCTDNAAMIGARAYYSIRAGLDLAGLDLNSSSKPIRANATDKV